MKVCNVCKSSDVPDDMVQCPFCGTVFNLYYELQNVEEPESIVESKSTYEWSEEDIPPVKESVLKTQRKPVKKIVIAFLIVCIVSIIIWNGGTKEVVESPSHDISQEVTSDTYEEVIQEVVTSEYVVENSDSVYLTREDLQYFTAEELRIARNEIYARHGRRFKDENLQAYFESCSWYNGVIEPDDFSEGLLNEYEKANVALLKKTENEIN